MNLIRQEKLIKTLIQYRFRKYGIDLVKVEIYDTFEDGKYMCRLEVFRGGTGVKHRLIKHEDFFDESFAVEAETRLSEIVKN